VAGTCERGNEPMGSIKCREFLDWLRTSWLLKKTLLHLVSKEYVFYELSVLSDITEVQTRIMYSYIHTKVFKTGQDLPTTNFNSSKLYFLIHFSYPLYEF
jgi:hypothetical protein